MAGIYKCGNKFRVSYCVNNKQIKNSLSTSNKRVARSTLRELECELALGDLHVATKLPLPEVPDAFCKELMATRTCKSYSNVNLEVVTELLGATVPEKPVEARYCLYADVNPAKQGTRP